MTSLSVVIPVRNGAAFLPRAVASVRDDAGRDCEIIVVDDGSTDDTREVASALAREGPLRILSSDKRTPAGTRNIGIAAATSEVLGFIDVDDEWMPGHTAELGRRLAADPGVDVVYGKVQVVQQDPDDALWNKLVIADTWGVFPLIGAGLYRRSVFDRVGLYEEGLRFGEDMDWFLRAGEEGVGLVIIDRPVLRYNLHAGNMSRDRAASTGAIASVLRRSLDRRRRGGTVRPLPQPSDFYERSAPRT